MIFPCQCQYEPVLSLLFLDNARIVFDDCFKPRSDAATLSMLGPSLHAARLEPGFARRNGQGSARCDGDDWLMALLFGELADQHWTRRLWTHRIHGVPSRGWPRFAGRRRSGTYRNANTNVAPSPSSSTSSPFCDTQARPEAQARSWPVNLNLPSGSTGNTEHAPTVKGGRLLTNNNDPRVRPTCEGRSSHGNNNIARRIVFVRTLCGSARMPWHSRRRPSEDACPLENVIRLVAFPVVE